MVIDPERFIRRLSIVGVVLIIVGVAVSQWWSFSLAILGLAIVVLSCYSAYDGLLLVGPFLKQEMTALVRKKTFYVWRVTAMMIGLLAFLGAASVRIFNPTPFAIQLSGSILVIASAYIAMLVVLPSATQLLLGSISGEREANRLDFLLVTDLRNREIILGRTVSKLLPIVTHLSVLLPLVLATSPFFGVPLPLILVPLAYLAITFFTTAGVTVYGSTISPTAKKTNLAVSAIVTPVALGTGLIELLRFRPEIWGYLFKKPGGGFFSVGDILEYVSAMNPIGIVIKVVQGLTGGGDPLDIALEWLPIYSAYHIAFGFLGFYFAARRLRTISATLAGLGPTGSTESGTRQLEKPMVSDRPIFWKERHFHELLPKTKKGVWIYRILGFLLSYLPAIAILIFGFMGTPAMRSVAKGLIGAALPLAAWVLLCVGLRVSAGAIARERERDTLTSLLVTPIPPEEILWEKWLGSFYAQMGGIAWLLIIGVPACITGLYPVTMLCSILILTLSFITVGNSLGILTSITAPKTEKSNQQAVLRGLLGVLVQFLTCLTPLILGAMKLLPFGIHIAIVLCPLLSLIVAGTASQTESIGQSEIVITALLAAAHMFITAWLVYRRAKAKFTEKCGDGTILNP